MTKSETGTQLLARLGARPSVSGLEPSLFGPGPDSGNIYEFYGGEGVGKTATALHLMAKCLLPGTWEGLELNGKGTGVILIDTEFKFPLFRLAVIMERWVKDAADNEKGTNFCRRSDSGLDRDLNGFCVSEDAKRTCGSYGDQEIVENFIQDCLKKLYILQCGSSFQLLMSLTSLENLLASNPNISLVVIDSISAYYWIDRCQIPEGHLAQDLSMKPIIALLDNYAKNYNLVLICVKSALVLRKSRPKQSKGDNSLNAEMCLQGDSRKLTEYLDDHCEFLGQSWSRFVTKRFIFNKLAGSGHFIVSWNQADGQKAHVKFSISDSGNRFIS